MPDTRSIDVHAHLFPQSAVRSIETESDWFGIRVWLDDQGRPASETERGSMTFGSPIHLEPPPRRIERMDEMGIDKQLISVLPPLYQYGRDHPAKIDSLRAVNDEIAEMMEQWPGRFGGLAALPLPDIDASLSEMARISDKGFAGVALGSHVDGRNWSDDTLLPILKSAQELRLLVFLHPILPRAPQALGEFYLRNLVGNPFETTVAVGSLVFGGVLDACPELQICLAHGGGYTCFAIGRFSHGYEARSELSGLNHPPHDYLDRFLYDTITHDSRSLQFMANRVGIERIVLGTDYPSDMGLANPVSWLDSQTWLDEDQRQHILSTNLMSVFEELGR